MLPRQPFWTLFALPSPADGGKLLQTLLGIRNEISTEFPNGAASLLREEVLQELMQKRPKSKGEWFRLIPQRMRMQTDSKQVGQFLPKVLEAITLAGT
jgi:hypothetical protein